MRILLNVPTVVGHAEEIFLNTIKKYMCLRSEDLDILHEERFARFKK